MVQDVYLRLPKSFFNSVIGVFFLVNFLGYSQNTKNYSSSTIDSYFYNLKSLNFLAIDSIIQTKNDTLFNTLRDLQKLKHQTYDNKYYSLNTTKSSDPFIQCIQYLNLGYQQFYLSNNHQDVYKNFHLAYQLAVDINYIPLVKQCLISILEYYQHDIAKSNTNPQFYIKKYEALNNDSVDIIWITLFKLIFASSNIFGVVDNYDTIVQEIPEIEKLAIHNKALTSKIYFEKALNNELNENLNSAEFYYELAIDESHNLPFLRYLRFSSTIKLANIEFKKKNYNKALQVLESANRYKHPIDTLTNSFYLNRYKAKFLNKLQEYDDAYNALLESTISETKLEYRKNIVQAAIQKVELDTEAKEKENLFLQSEVEKEQRQKRYLWIGGSIIFLFLSLIGFLTYKNTKRKQLLAEKGKALEAQKLATVLKEQELKSIDAMIAGQEKERQRIANDLHDDLGSLMANVKLHFDALKDNPSPELYSKANTLIETAYHKIRGMAHAKNSGVMANKGLLKAIHEIANSNSIANKLNIEVVDYGLEQQLENSLELTIFRIIQELIANIIKHADATEATIHITNHEDTINVMVEDNGKGFDTKTISKHQGMGIHSIDKRIENLGGTVTIESEINKGTTVIIDIPTL